MGTKNLYRFVAQVTEKQQNYPGLAEAHAVEVSAFAKDSLEAEKKIRSRYRKDGRFQIEELQFVG